MKTNTRISNARELIQFGKLIKENLGDTLSRLRAAYLWVINNIRYDCEGLKAKNARWALDSVLTNRKAICAGYVNVFRNLCEASGIECVDVQGYGRSGFDDLLVKADSAKAINHTWNAVKVEGEWKLVDVTWASGFTSEDCSTFTRQRNDWYFCTDPKKFIWDHYPKDSSWQLLTSTVGWQEFQQYPLLYPGVVDNAIMNFYPRTAVLHKSKSDTIQFYFSTPRPYNRIIISSRKHPGLYRMDIPDITADGYRYTYRVEKEGSYDLQIDLLYIENTRPLVTYQVKTYTDIVYWIDTKALR